jgi:hypothetical protein
VGCRRGDAVSRATAVTPLSPSLPPTTTHTPTPSHPLPAHACRPQHRSPGGSQPLRGSPRLPDGCSSQQAHAAWSAHVSPADAHRPRRHRPAQNQRRRPNGEGHHRQTHQRRPWRRTRPPGPSGQKRRLHHLPVARRHLPRHLHIQIHSRHPVGRADCRKHSCIVCRTQTRLVVAFPHLWNHFMMPSAPWRIST